MKAWYEAGHVCWDDKDLVGGRPTGAVRASFGFASTAADADAVAALVRRHFLEEHCSEEGGGGRAPKSVESSRKSGDVGRKQLTVRSLVVYPIKSCPGVAVAAWPLGERHIGGEREREREGREWFHVLYTLALTFSCLT